MTLYVLIPLLSIIILGGITVFRMIWLLKKGEENQMDCKVTLMINAVLVIILVLSQDSGHRKCDFYAAPSACTAFGVL